MFLHTDDHHGDPAGGGKTRSDGGAGFTTVEGHMPMLIRWYPIPRNGPHGGSETFELHVAEIEARERRVTCPKL